MPRFPGLCIPLSRSSSAGNKQTCLLISPGFPECRSSGTWMQLPARGWPRISRACCCVVRTRSPGRIGRFRRRMKKKKKKEVSRIISIQQSRSKPPSSSSSSSLHYCHQARQVCYALSSLLWAVARLPPPSYYYCSRLNIVVINKSGARSEAFEQHVLRYVLRRSHYYDSRRTACSLKVIYNY